MTKYDYKFVRLRLDRTDLYRNPTANEVAPDSYPAIIRQHGAEGWRLVQIFTPEFGQSFAFSMGTSYIELIFEREAS